MKVLGVNSIYLKGLNITKKIGVKVISSSILISKKMYNVIAEKIIDKSLKTVYLITIKCNDKVIETAIIYGNEKDAISKFIKMNKKINCQGDKNFELTKITPDDIKNMLSKN